MTLVRHRLQHRSAWQTARLRSWITRLDVRRLGRAALCMVLAASLAGARPRRLGAQEYGQEAVWAEQILLSDSPASDAGAYDPAEQESLEEGVRPTGFLLRPLRRHRCGPRCLCPCPHARSTEQAPAEHAAPPEETAPQDMAEAPPQPDLGDLAMADDMGLFDSGLGGARAPGSAYTPIVGDAFFSGGQLQVQPSPTLVPGTITYSELLADTSPPTSFSSEAVYFYVNSALNPPVISQWSVTELYGPEPGASGTATLQGIDSSSGLAVASVAVPTLVTVIPRPVIVDVPSPAGLGRTKIAENNSPFPVDRVFFNYNYYHNALQGPGPGGARRNIGPNRYLFGLEKTFLGGDASIEVRAPLASTLNSDQNLDGSGDIVHGEFGNMMLTLKLALWRTEGFIIAGGLGVTVPTADDVRVFDTSSATPIVRIRNDAVHLGPYLAMQYRSGRFFWQLWVQTDVDPWGNGVILNLPQESAQTGRLQDQTMLLVSSAFGYAVFRSSTDGAGRLGLTRVTPAIEIHQTSSLQSADFITAGNLVLGNFANNFDVVNLTIATHFQFFNRGIITPAYVVPLTQNDNRFFDGELGVQANWRY